MKHLKSYKESFDNRIDIVIGDENINFKGYDDYEDYAEYLELNNNKVKLTQQGFAKEWVDFVDFDESYAHISNGKLYITIYGIPKYINKDKVIEFYKNQINHRLKTGYGEFFETEPGNPICLIVNQNGKEVIL